MSKQFERKPLEKIELACLLLLGLPAIHMFIHVDIPSGFTYSGVWILLVVKYIQRQIIQSTPPVKTVITVSKQSDDYMAVINGYDAIWGCGPTPAVAVMDVLTHHPEQHDIEFEIQDWWVTTDSPSTIPSCE